METDLEMTLITQHFKDQNTDQKKGVKNKSSGCSFFALSHDCTTTM